MTDLTEQWKNGELEKDWYYVKGADGLFGIMPDYALYRVNLEHPDNTISLLASVPSYEEWQQLKELLKEYKKQLSEIKDAYMDLTTQDEYGSYYIEEAKLFIEIVGKTIKDLCDFELKQDEEIKC